MRTFRSSYVRSVRTSCGTAVFDVTMVHVTCLLPKNDFTACNTAADQKPCPDGYSGWFTLSRGLHDGSPAVTELSSSSARGIAVLGEAFRFDGSDPERAAAVARIAAIYGTRRIELINYVASQTLKRIQSIADAFRIKKDEGHE